MQKNVHSTRSIITQSIHTSHGFQIPLNILPSIDVTDFAKLLLKYSTDGILLTDSTGLVIAMNKSYSKLFQIPTSEVLGSNVLELVSSKKISVTSADHLLILYS